MGKKMISIKNLHKSFGAGESRTEVLKGITLDIADHDFMVLLGASGSGKSTLLNVISGLEPSDSGEIQYDGRDISGMKDKEITLFRKTTIGFVFQQYFLLPNLNVDKNVRMGADLAHNPEYRKLIEDVGLRSAGPSCSAHWRAVLFLQSASAMETGTTAQLPGTSSSCSKISVSSI